MKRRDFLTVSGAAVGAAMAPGELGAFDVNKSAPAPVGTSTSQRAPEVVVVGAGAFGAWTAYSLQQRGVSVALLDAYGPGNPRATSGGETRQIRAGYGSQEIYTRWAIDSFGRWHDFEAETGADLLVRTGRLTMAPGMTQSMRDTTRVLDANGVENEVMDAEEMARRWPQISPEGLGVVHFEPGAAAIRAAYALRVVAQRLEELGTAVRIARVAPGSTSGSRLTDLELSDGSRIEAQTFVLALGPWLPRMFPDLLRSRIATPRRDVLHFGPPPGDPRFSAPNLPNFSEGSASYYGFPSIDDRGLKLAPTGGNIRFDPDTDERIIAGYQVKRGREYLAKRFPALANQPLVESRVCQLEDTPDTHFIIDQHPEWENVWLAGGGTGHAFKLGPTIGDHVAGRVVGEASDAELAATFSLGRF